MAGERESQIQQMANAILEAGDKIIEERNWSKTPSWTNLAAHLYDNWYLGKTLRECQQGSIPPGGIVIGFGGYGLAPIELHELHSQYVWGMYEQTGAPSWRDYYQQVSQLLSEFTKKLGFLEEGEDLSLFNRRIRKTRSHFPDFTLNHPTKSFRLGIIGRAEAEGQILLHNIIIRYRPRAATAGI